MQLTSDDVEEVDALYIQNLRGIAELSGGEINKDNFHEVTMRICFYFICFCNNGIYIISQPGYHYN